MEKQNPNFSSSSEKSATSSSPIPKNSTKQHPQSQIASIIKAYCIPATLFLLFLIFQVVLIPKSFPPSHYDVLGLRWQSSVEEVEEAYESFVSKWNSGAKLPMTNDFIKIRYAYELLTNPLWKRDFDLFGVDEHQHVLKNLMQLNSGKDYSSLKLPLLDTGSIDSHDIDFNTISFEDLQSVIGNKRPWLVKIYSSGSKQCLQFTTQWKKIATLLGEVADLGVIELGDFNLASHLAERKATGQPFFRNGLPSLIAFPQGCRSSNCLVRYEGELSVDAITDWFASNILKLPRIPYYTKDSLGPRFLSKSSYHKVKIMVFSDTGMRATPFVRQLAKNYQDYASFACVLWREEESSFWWTTYGLESAPATVFLKDPGTKPLIYYGSLNSSWFVDVMEDNKLHELPQLRSVTSMDLGCDARGYSRAGSNTNIWYCVIVIGRPSPELNQMREVLRRVQHKLSDECVKDTAISDELAAPSAIALKDKRLTFAWMDGEVQKNLCMFYIGGEHSLNCCGPRRSMEDAPQIVMVRYMRNDSAADIQDKKASNSLFDVLKDDVDPVSQLVARYDGSSDPVQIMEWISKIVKDGDSAKLPFFRTSTPELVPEDPNSLWFTSNEKFISTSYGIKHNVHRIVAGGRSLSGDPRTGPVLLLGALLSFGGIWLRRSQPTSSSDQSESRQTRNKEDIPKEWRNRRRTSLSAEVPPSMTDVEPKGAYQMEFSDSDKE
ncbi:hypothetical protein RND81_10G216600 [Saponaria officinalis]|uniref:J domain-containing protein n=1 Tax=Saponaria officinalis TaxID=3572 RepID=A0AAW1I6K1_SAPOF